MGVVKPLFFSFASRVGVAVSSRLERRWKRRRKAKLRASGTRAYFFRYSGKFVW
jgi:hypothetical protein